MRAGLLRQSALRDQLLSKLNGGDMAGWNEDEPAVVEAAAELLLHQFFGASYDVRAVTAFAADLHEATAARPRPLPTAVSRSL
jgi:hypothetical protein